MNFKKCAHPDCNEKAVLFSDYCYLHAPDKEVLLSKVIQYIKDNDKLKGLNFAFIPLTGVEFFQKDLSFSRFSHCSMNSCSLKRCILVSTFLDFADLRNSQFIETECKLSIFGGADLRDVSFEESAAVFCNFLGADIDGVKFHTTDLSHSRFINSVTDTVEFYNCNLKKTIFNKIKFSNKSLRTSNCEDAIIFNVDCKSTSKNRIIV